MTNCSHCRKYNRKYKDVFSERDKVFNIFRTRSIRNATEMGHFLFILVIGSGLCIIAPLVLILAVLAFAFTWLSLRYRVLYLYTRKTESGGLAFPLIFQKMIACLGIMVFCTACALAGKRMDFAAAFSFFPLLVILLIMRW